LRLDHPEISVVFRHFPLSSACNSAAQTDFHPHSCHAARAAEAARRQNRFWEFHDAAFATSEKLEDATLQALAKVVGLDLDRFNTERRDAESNFRVNADVQLGGQLKIDGTPTVFVNGRLVETKWLPYLREIVEHELGNAISAKKHVPRPSE